MSKSGIVLFKSGYVRRSIEILIAWIKTRGLLQSLPGHFHSRAAFPWPLESLSFKAEGFSSRPVGIGAVDCSCQKNHQNGNNEHQLRFVTGVPGTAGAWLLLRNGPSRLLWHLRKDFFCFFKRHFELFSGVKFFVSKQIEASTNSAVSRNMQCYFKTVNFYRFQMW